jgi:hypothetical protein
MSAVELGTICFTPTVLVYSHVSSGFWLILTGVGLAWMILWLRVNFWNLL